MRPPRCRQPQRSGPGRYREGPGRGCGGERLPGAGGQGHRPDLRAVLHGRGRDHLDRFPRRVERARPGDAEQLRKRIRRRSISIHRAGAVDVQVRSRSAGGTRRRECGERNAAGGFGARESVCGCGLLGHCADVRRLRVQRPHHTGSPHRRSQHAHRLRRGDRLLLRRDGGWRGDGHAGSGRARPGVPSEGHLGLAEPAWVYTGQPAHQRFQRQQRRDGGARLGSGHGLGLPVFVLGTSSSATVDTLHLPSRASGA